MWLVKRIRNGMTRPWNFPVVKFNLNCDDKFVIVVLKNLFSMTCGDCGEEVVLDDIIVIQIVVQVHINSGNLEMHI